MTGKPEEAGSGGEKRNVSNAARGTAELMELTKLKGIGEKTELLLQKLNLRSVEDLVEYLPSDYLFYPEATEELTEEELDTRVAFSCVLEKEASLLHLKGVPIVSCYGRTINGRAVRISYFHAPFMKQQLHKGGHYVFLGKLSRYQSSFAMQQPKLYSYEEYQKKTGKLEPIYGLTKGLRNASLRKAMAQALLLCPPASQVPERFLYNRNLLSRKEALAKVHFPKDEAEMRLARASLSYEELLLFSLAIQQTRRDREEKSSYRMEKREELETAFSCLPFELTEGQRLAISEIREDLCSGIRMHRLLQGDVGSGKTILAFYAMFLTAFSGFQAALMAPTEILARQHYEKMQRMISERHFPFSAVLLTGSTREREKREIRERILRGEAKLIIGTHALFQEKTAYRKLALVITDEQHRFGVMQRQGLSEKGEEPHVLIMSATPIPRTLALLLYAGLKVSRMQDRPAARLPIKNAVIPAGDRRKAYRHILREVGKGHQAYLICPMIMKNEESELKNVCDSYHELRQLFPRQLRLGILHGRMKAEEKEAVMEAFLGKRIDLLISTTVVEVGVDVPNATVMMIENAERFGLSQLHQLRGRVGRGTAQSYCIFVDHKQSKLSRERLSVLAQSNDGFFIAEEDLRLRGPGELFGVMQSGELHFSVANLYDNPGLLQQAMEDAAYLLSTDPELKNPENRVLQLPLKRYLEKSRSI